MTRRSGGDKRSSWLVFQRRLFLIRQLIRGPARSVDLIAAARAAFGQEIYPFDAAAALRHDLHALRAEFGCAIMLGGRREYVLAHPGTLALVDLPDAELEALAYLYGSFGESPLPNSPQVVALLDRVVSLMPEDRRRALRQRAAYPRLDLPVSQSSPPADLLAKLKSAVGRQFVAFDYRSSFASAGAVVRHRVAPYGLLFRDGHVYLDAFCHECSIPEVEGRYTLYRVDRIVAGTLQLLPRQLPPGAPARRWYELAYELSPTVAGQRDIAQWFPGSDVHYRPDGSALVQARVSDLWQARQILLRYREHCRVVSPPELSAMIGETVRRLEPLYPPPGDGTRETAASYLQQRQEELDRVFGALLRIDQARPPMIDRKALRVVLERIAAELRALVGTGSVQFELRPDVFAPPFSLSVGVGEVDERATMVTRELMWGGVSLGWISFPAAGEAHAAPLLLRMASETIAEVASAETVAARTAEETRRWLAAELHDAVKQTLPAIRLLAELVERDLGRDPRQAAQRLGDIREMAQQGLDEMTFLLGGLRGSTTADDLRTALERLVGNYRRLAADTVIQASLDIPAVPWDMAACVLGLVRNGLSNAVQHAGARLIRLDVAVTPASDELVLAVTDDGVGMDAEVALAAPGIGIEIMAERVQALGGRLQIERQAEGGTCVSAWIPLAAAPSP